MSRIFCRYSDKVTYWIIIFTITICFFISLAIFIYFQFFYLEYFNDMQICAANQDFECMIENNIDKDTIIYNTMLIIAINLSIMGGFLSGVFIMLYKHYKERTTL